MQEHIDGKRKVTQIKQKVQLGEINEKLLVKQTWLKINQTESTTADKTGHSKTATTFLPASSWGYAKTY